MVNTEDGIVRRYKHEPTKEKIKILAELNGVKVEIIEDILRKNGCLIDTKKKDDAEPEVISPPNYQRPPYAVIVSINARIGSLKDQITAIREDIRRKDQMVIDCQNEITVLDRYLKEVQDDCN